MKICSWNVNGLRAVIRKGALDTFLESEKPDIICLQEIKSKKDQVEVDFSEYVEVWNPAERAGYAGTAIFVKNGIPFSRVNLEEFKCEDNYGDVATEGRIIVLEFLKFFLVTVYTPNSKRDLSRLSLREKTWDPEFLKLLKNLEEKKPVVVCGDFNAAHEEIDLARPNDNHHNAGFTDEERKGISNLIEAGFVDTFRNFHPEEIKYSWWSNLGHAREKNVGWRIDYFFVSKSFLGKVSSAEIHDEFFGSDHCPISIEVKK